MTQLKKITLDGSTMQATVSRDRQAALGGIQREGIALAQEMRQGIGDYSQYLNNILREDAERGIQANSLDAAIAHGENFRETIAEVTAGLTKEFQEIGEVFASAQDYTTLSEKFYSWIGWKSRAQKAQLGRVMKQDIKENLEELLKYGVLMIERIGEHIVAHTENEALMEGTTKQTDGIIQESQEQYDAWQAQRLQLEEQVNSLTETMQGISEEEYAKKVVEQTALTKQYKEAQGQENLYFKKLERAKQARPVQMRQLEAIRNIKSAMEQFRVQIDEDLKHVTNVYLTTPQNIRSALATKAAESYDKVKNLTTEKALEATVAAERAILNATAARAEKQLIDPEHLEAITRYHKASQADFEARIARLKDQAAAYRPA